jgi:hypothetical protein
LSTDEFGDKFLRAMQTFNIRRQFKIAFHYIDRLAPSGNLVIGTASA